MGLQIYSVNMRITSWYVLLVVISTVSSSSPDILTPIYSLVPSLHGFTRLFDSGVDVVEMCALDEEGDDDKSILRI